MTREQFEQAVKRLDERIPELDPQRIFVEILRIVAQVKDGHTRVTKRDPDGFAFRRYPLRLYLYSDGLFVQEAAPEYARAVGARVVKIGSATTEQAIRAAREICSHDNEMQIKTWIPRWLVIPEALRGLGLIEDMEKSQFVVEQRGEQIAIDLKPVSIFDPEEKWIDARDKSAPPPLWLKDPRNLYWFEYLPDSKTVYVQYNAVAEKKDETIAAFAKRLFDFVEANSVDRFVLDIRRNGGGSAHLNLPFIHGLIRSDKLKEPGKFFVIIGRNTFSAAMFFVGDLEQHARPIFIGEPTGGKANHYGVNGTSAQTSFILPHSRLVIELSNEFMQRGAPGDDSPWKAPHLAAELSSEDYRANLDPAMEIILSYKPRPPLEDTMLDIFLKQGMEAATRYYRAFKADPVNAYVDKIWPLRLVGRRLMNVHKRFTDAIEIFKFTVAEHPQSDHALYLLADAYERSGDLKQAIENYEKAVALNPKNWDFVDHLKSLREKQGRGGQWRICANLTAGPALRRANVIEKARFHADRRAGHRAGRRRRHWDFQSGGRDNVAAFFVSESGKIGDAFRAQS
jgi:tetratricopeptide (TPR) repeat protein